MWRYDDQDDEFASVCIHDSPLISYKTKQTIGCNLFLEDWVVVLALKDRKLMEKLSRVLHAGGAQVVELTPRMSGNHEWLRQQNVGDVLFVCCDNDPAISVGEFEMLANVQGVEFVTPDYFRDVLINRFDDKVRTGISISHF